MVMLFVGVVMRVLRTELPRLGAGRVEQGQARGTLGRVERAVEPGRHGRADPDDEIGLREGRDLAGLELHVMGIRPALQKQHRLAEIAHHLGHQRLDRRNVGDDLRHLGPGGAGEGGDGEQERYGITHGSGLPDGSRSAYRM